MIIICCFAFPSFEIGKTIETMPSSQSPWRQKQQQPNVSNFIKLLGRCMANWAPPIAGDNHPQIGNDERRALERAYCLHGGIRRDDIAGLASFLESHFRIRCTSEGELRQRLAEAAQSLKTEKKPLTPTPPRLTRRRSTLRSHNSTMSHVASSTVSSNQQTGGGSDSSVDRYIRTDVIAAVVAIARRSIAADQLAERMIATDDPSLATSSWSELSNMIFSWLCGPECYVCSGQLICSFVQHLFTTVLQQVATIVDYVKSEYGTGTVSRLDFNECVFPMIRDASPLEDLEAERTQAISNNLQWTSRPRIARNSSFVARQVVGAFKDLVANREDTSQLSESIRMLSRRSKTASQVRVRVLNDPKSYFKMPACVLRAADLSQLMKISPKLLRSFASRARKVLRNSMLKYAQRWLSAIERAADLLQRHSEKCERCAWYSETSVRWSSPTKGSPNRFQSFSGLGSVVSSPGESRRGGQPPPLRTPHQPQCDASQDGESTIGTPRSGYHAPFTPRTTKLPTNRPHPADSPRLNLGNMEDAFVLNVYRRATIR